MKILFITPHGGYTGSEMLIWQLMQELVKRGKSVAWFARNEGALHNHIGEVAFPARFYPQESSFTTSIYEGFYKKLTDRLPVDNDLLRYHREQKPDLWYLNTAVMPDVAALARREGIPYVVHLHELTSVFDEQRAEPFLEMLTRAQALIGCSGVVQRRLHQLGFPDTKLMYSCIDQLRIQVHQPVAAMRSRMNIPNDVYLWMMSGTESLRKGYDLIPDILTHLPQDVYVAWIGKPRDSALRTYVERRVASEQLRFIALGEQSTAYFDYLNAADGFILTSREDPFPLVMIEAAALGKPIAAFNSGGVSEFVRPGMGGVVDSFNPGDLAHLMERIRRDELPTQATVSKARASEFSMIRQADDFCRIFNL